MDDLENRQDILEWLDSELPVKRVWTEKEIALVKRAARLLLNSGFRVNMVAHLLEVSPSSIYKWRKS